MSWWNQSFRLGTKNNFLEMPRICWVLLIVVVLVIVVVRHS